MTSRPRLGSRQMTTLRKDPTQAPRAKKKTAKAMRSWGSMRLVYRHNRPRDDRCRIRCHHIGQSGDCLPALAYHRTDVADVGFDAGIAWDGGFVWRAARGDWGGESGAGDQLSDGALDFVSG